MSTAIWHAAVSYYLPSQLLLFNEVVWPNGWTCDFYQMAGLVITLQTIIVHLKIFIVWHRQDAFALFSYIVSLLCFGLLCLLSNSVLM